MDHGAQPSPEKYIELVFGPEIVELDGFMDEIKVSAGGCILSRRLCVVAGGSVLVGRGRNCDIVSVSVDSDKHGTNDSRQPCPCAPTVPLALSAACQECLSSIVNKGAPVTLEEVMASVTAK